MAVRRPLVLTGGQHAELPTGDRLLGAGSNPVAKTTAYTAAPWDLVLGDASGGAFTVSPPSSPSPGDEVAVVKVDASANPITWGGPVNDETAAQLVSKWAGATFCWTGAVWVVLASPTVASPAQSWTQILNKPSFAAVATSGAYSDLSGKPTLATVAVSGAYGDLSGRPALAEVATSWSYADLANTPVSAPPWAASTTYRVGDLVWQAAILYRRKTAGTSGATFDASMWDVVGPSAGGGGGSDSDGRNLRRTFPAARVGDWVADPVITPNGRPFPNGELILGWHFLPEGTWDAAGFHLNNVASAGGVLKMVAYADDNGRVGSLMTESATVDATTPGGARAITSGMSIVCPAGGRGFWAGLVCQGAPSTTPNVIGVDRTGETTVFSSQPTLLWAAIAPTWSVTGVTGAAPTSPTASASTTSPARLAFRRSA